MRGSKTPAKVVAKFRGEYLKSGNAEAAGRICKIPAATAKDLAHAANQDPKFAEARRKLNAHALEEAQAMLLDELREAHHRFMEKPLSAEGIAQLMVKHKLRSFNYQDPRPQYLAQQVNAVRALTAHQKMIAEQGASKPMPVKLEIEFTDGSSTDSAGSPDAEVSIEPSTEPKP